MLRFLLIPVLALLPLLAWADDAIGWLERLASAPGRTNYQGHLVYVRGGEVASFRLTHVQDRGQPWDYLVRLDGRNAEVLRDGGSMILRDRAGSAARLQAMPPVSSTASLQQHLSQLPSHYELDLVPSSRVAGRAAVRLRLQPRQNDRYGYELSVDKASGVLLRSRMLGSDGQVLETFSFSDIEIGPRVGLDVYQAARRNQPATKTVTKPAVVVQGPVVRVPPGFTLVGKASRQKQINGRRVVMSSYSDGLSSFTVFYEPAAPVPAAGNSRQRGATAFASRELETEGMRFLVTAVGELPLPVLQQVVDSATPARP